MGFVTIGAESHTGIKRADNQDYYDFHIPEGDTIYQKGVLMTVADGMGGHSGGVVASTLAVNVLVAEYYRDKSSNITKSLKNAFLKANHDVYYKAKNSDLSRMGTTLTAVVLKRDKMYYAHVGDSRGYLICDKEILQFTEDHSHVASLVRAGVISEEEAKTHPERNKITRAIGVHQDVVVDVSDSPKRIKEGDCLLLCSDGLHGVISKEKILNTILIYKEPSVVCKKLVEMANEQGGPDNITVLIARIDR